MQNVRLSFDPPPAGGTTTLQETGPWGLFRLFARGALRRDPTTPGRYTLDFKLGERTVQYDVRMGTTPTQNPFDMSLLTDFRCPAVQ